MLLKEPSNLDCYRLSVRVTPSPFFVPAFHGEKLFIIDVHKFPMRKIVYYRCTSVPPEKDCLL